MNYPQIIDLKIHQLSQTLAKFNRTYVPKESDDSHTNIGLDNVNGYLISRWIKSPSSQSEYILLAFDVINFDFLILDDLLDGIQEFPTKGKTQAQVEDDIALYLDSIGAGHIEDFKKKLHFEIPSYDFKDQIIEPLNEEEAELFLEARQRANIACQFFYEYVKRNGQIRIWPHHFDTGVYVKMNSKVGIGFGLAIADEMIEAPYLYCTPYGLNEHKIDISKFKALTYGQWIDHVNYKGAILLLADMDPMVVKFFVTEVVNTILDSLK